jgi:hypothetical protein
MNPPGSSDESSFYNSYDWCLIPALKLSELLRQFQQEIDRYDHLTIAWQREECRINPKSSAKQFHPSEAAALFSPDILKIILVR